MSVSKSLPELILKLSKRPLLNPIGLIDSYEGNDWNGYPIKSIWKNDYMQLYLHDWTKEEDEAFNAFEKQSNLGKHILKDMGQPYHFDVFVSISQRNQVLEEVAKEIEKMEVFGKDTISSFTIVIRNMKRTEG